MTDLHKRTIVLDIDFDAFIREPTILDWGHSESGLFQEIVWHPRAIGWAGNPNFDLGEILTPPNGPHLDGFWDRMARAGWKFSDKTWGMAADSHATIGYELNKELSNWLRKASAEFDYEEGEEPEWPDGPITIYHIDAHHDLGYSDDQVADLMKRKRISCDSWLYLLAHSPEMEKRVEKIVVVYPEWRREPCPATKMRIDEGYEELLQRRAESLWKIGCELEIVYWNDLVVPEDHIDWITMAQSSAWVPPWYDQAFLQWMQASPVFNEDWHTNRLRQHFGEDNDHGKFKPRQGWPDNWADVKATYGHILPMAQEASDERL